MIRLIKIFILLLILALIIKSFVVDAYRIPTGSMKNTLLEGDFILVNKMSYKFSTPHHVPFIGSKISHYDLFDISAPEFNDVIAFEIPVDLYDPGSKDYAVLIKRIVGLPGDTLEIKDQVVYINNQKYYVPSFLRLNFDDLPIENTSTKLFPYDTKWTVDNYGPIVIPKKGMTIELNPKNILQWQNAINTDFGKKVISVEGTVVTLNGRPLREYTFNKDFYFVLGDNRRNSIDSRYFGYVPQEWIIGKALIVYWSQIPSQSKGFFDYFSTIRFSRLFKSID